MITHKGVLFLAIICVLFMSVSVSAIGSQGGSYTEAIMHYDDVKKEFIVVGVNEDVDVSFTEACYDLTCARSVRTYTLSYPSAETLVMRVNYSESVDGVYITILDMDYGEGVMKPQDNFFNSIETLSGYSEQVFFGDEYKAQAHYIKNQGHTVLKVWNESGFTEHIVDGKAHVRLRTSMGTLYFDSLEPLPFVEKGLSYIMRFNEFWTEWDINKTTLQVHDDGEWVDVVFNITNGSVFSFGKFQFQMGEIDTFEKTANLNMLSNGGFDRLYSTYGNYMVIDTGRLPAETYAGLIYDPWGKVTGNLSAFFVPVDIKHNQTYGHSTVAEFDIRGASDDNIEFNNFPTIASVLDIYFLYSEDERTYSDFGKDNNDRLAVSHAKQLFFDKDIHKYFIASYFEEEPEDPLKKRLVSYYKLDETSGDVIDSHGNNDGVNHGATRGVAGKIGNAFNFDGINDYVNLGRTDRFRTEQGEMSMSMWVYMDDYNNFILSNYDGGTFENGDFNLRIDQGTFDLAVQFGQGNNRGIAYISDSSIGDISGKWTHIAFTCDTSRGNNEKIRAWVDGTEIAMSNQGGYEGSGNVLMDNHVHLRLGGSYVSHFHNGMIDEVGIWNRTLSTDETLKLYNNGDGWSY